MMIPSEILMRGSAETRPSLGAAAEWALGRLRGSKFLRNAGVLSGGSAVGHVFTLAAAPLLARIYSPSQFAALGLFTSMISVAGVGVTLQYELSIVCGSSDSEAMYLLFASLLSTIPVSLLSALFLLALIRTSSLGFGSMFAGAAPLMALCMFAIGVFTALRYWSLRDRRFGVIARANVMQSAGRGVAQLSLGLAGLHAVGLLAGETLGRCCGMYRLSRSTWPAVRAQAASFKFAELRSALWNHRKFPLYSLPSSFLDALCLALPLPLLIRLYGADLGGYYSLVWKAVAVPSVLITTAVADTLHERLAGCVRSAPGHLIAVFRRAALGLLIAGVFPSMILWFFGPALFRWVFGQSWAESGQIASLIVPWYLAQFIVSPLSRIVVVLSGQELKLAWDIACLLSLLGIFAVAQSRHMPALTTVSVLSWAYAFLFMLYFGILLRILFRFQRQHARYCAGA